MTEEKPTLKLSTILLCDDVRKEDNGKEFLIGVYSGNILLSELPTNLIVCLWLLAETRIAGDVEKEIRFLRTP